MARQLFAHLDDLELSRAEALTLFASEDRLARKPRCGNEKDFSVIRTAAHALTHPYIQANGPMAYSRLVFDLDWHGDNHKFSDLPLTYLAATHAWENDLDLPTPSWAAISRVKNSAHIGYELETPVGRHEHARMKPQRYLAAIEAAMSKKLGADEGFNGQLCKNPLNSKWDLYKGPQRARDLHELADYVELEKKRPIARNRIPRGEVGRNVYLFDEVRFWAYDNVRVYRAGSYESWQQSVIATAERINAVSYAHLRIAEQALLPFSECKAIGRSVARWVWANLGQRKFTAAFSELQASRGVLGAASAARVKREQREQQIIAAIGQLTSQGQIATMGKTAELIGCSKSTLSQHYGHFFQGVLQ